MLQGSVGKFLELSFFQIVLHRKHPWDPCMVVCMVCLPAFAININDGKCRQIFHTGILW